jgi:uncharacterized membrane protein YbhN (UPF0104 family)
LSQLEPLPTPRSSRRKLIKRAIKLAIGLLVAIGLAYAVDASIKQWRAETSKIEIRLEELDRQWATADSEPQRQALQQERAQLSQGMPSLVRLNWSLIGLAGLLYGIGLVPNGLLLHNALHALGQRPRLTTSIAAHLLGHVGKYVPGKAMVVVLRAGSLSRDGVRLAPATIAIFLETFMMMAVGAAIAASIVIWLPVPSWISLLALGTAVAASLPTLPPILRIAAAKVSRSSELKEDTRIGYGLFAAGWAWSLLTWALIGASFTAVILAIPTPLELPPPATIYAIGTAAISLAVVIGFASLLPGGAGIRELVLTTILSVSLGPAHGLLAAIAARILYLALEAGLAAACWLWLRHTQPVTNLPHVVNSTPEH